MGAVKQGFEVAREIVRQKEGNQKIIEVIEFVSFEFSNTAKSLISLLYGPNGNEGLFKER